MCGDCGAGCWFWFSCLPSPLVGCLDWLGDAIAGYGSGFWEDGNGGGDGDTEGLTLVAECGCDLRCFSIASVVGC
jgi:hypothetical protein